MAIDNTRQLIEQIRNASNVGENTATRVGNAMEAMLNDVKAADDKANAATSRINTTEQGIANANQRLSTEEGINAAQSAQIEGLRQDIQNIRPVTIEGDVVNNPDNVFLTSANDEITPKERTTSLSAKGHYIMRPTDNFAAKLKANYIHEIPFDVDLGGASVTIPANAVLKFTGGCITNGTLTGNYTTIDADGVQIFGGVTLSGTWENQECFAEWWGAKGDNVADDRFALQMAVDSVFPCVRLLSKKYAIKSYKTVNGKNVGLHLQKAIEIVSVAYTGEGSPYVNSYGCIYADVSGLDATILIDSRNTTLRGFIVKGSKNNQPKRHISTPFDLTHLAYLRIENVSCNYCTEEAFYILAYLTIIRNCLANTCGGGFLVGGSVGLDEDNPTQGTPCPALTIEHNYVIGAKKRAYVFNAMGYSVINNCAADGCGFNLAVADPAESNIYPVYTYRRCSSIAVSGCSNEVACKPLEMNLCTAVTFTSCSFLGNTRNATVDDAAEAGGWVKALITNSRCITFTGCRFVSYYSRYISVLYDATYNFNADVHFNQCTAYIGTNSSHLPITGESFVEGGIQVINYDHATMLRDASVGDWGVAEDKAFSIYNEIIETKNPMNGKYAYFPKTLSYTGANNITLYSPAFKNYKGTLIYDGNGKRNTMYTLVVTNVELLVIRNISEWTLVPSTTHTITDSVVDASALSLLDGGGTINLVNSTLIISDAMVVHRSANYIVNCDENSIVKVKRVAGDYWLSKDGKTPLASGSARPTLTAANIGYQFFDTSLNQPIWWTGSTWVKSDGTTA